MNFFLNYILAWATVFILIFLSFKYVIRKLAMGNGNHKEFFRKLNKDSRKSHIVLGVISCITALIHGLFSSESILTLNIGTLLCIIIILLGLSYPIRKVFKNKKTWLIIHRVLTVATLVLIVVHVLDVGGIGIFKELEYLSSNNSVAKIENVSPTPNIPVETAIVSDTTDIPVETAIVSPTTDIQTTKDTVIEVETDSLEEYNSNLFGVVLKDGTYTGVSDAYGPNLTVEVVVSNNKVTNISVVSHNEKNSRFYATPIKEIPESIIDSQSLEVDTVSGATFTSVGIINAVNEALSQAVVSGQLPKMLTLPTGRRH